MVLCTRPTHKHYKNALIASVSRFFCNTSLWDFSQERKKEIINLFLNPRRSTLENSKEKNAIHNGSENGERTWQGSCNVMNLFIEGYGSSTKTESLLAIKKIQGL